jgi:cyclophilin family peptidyl-prolyl cis-trans isomerase
MTRALKLIVILMALIVVGGTLPASAGEPMLAFYLLADGSSGRSEINLDGDIWNAEIEGVSLSIPYSRMAYVSYIPPMVELTAGERIEGIAPMQGHRLTFFLSPHREPRSWELGTEVVGWSQSKSGMDDLKRIYSEYKEQIDLEWEAQFEDRLMGVIEPGRTYKAAFEMEKGGQFIVELDPSLAPNTVANFVDLVRKGFYDGLTFHRVLDGFMAQGGDPEGTGMGGSEHNIKGEFGGKHLRGTISMARAEDPDSASSQFFICFVDCPFLDGKYAAFGQVVEGMDVVDNITRRDPQQNPDFPGDRIKSVTIIEE